MTAGQAEVAGTFRQHPFPKLLFYLYRKQYTGVMTMGGPGAENTVFFREGMPVMAQITDQVEALGEILLQMGVIDASLYNQSLAQMAQTGQRQGDVLRAIGAVTDEQIDFALKQQVTKKVSRLFRLIDAPFAIYRQEHEFGRDPQQAARQVHPRRIIYHGIRNTYDLPRILREVGDALQNRSFRIDPQKGANLERYQFSEDDRALVEMLQDGLWSVQGLADRSGRGLLDVWMMVYALFVTEMLELRDAAEPRFTPAPAPAPAAAAPPTVVTARPTANPTPFSSQTPRTSSAPSRVAVKTGSTTVRGGTIPPGRAFQATPGHAPPRSGSKPPTQIGPNPLLRPPSKPPVAATKAEVSAKELAALTPEARALKQQIDEKLKFIDKQNHFEVLVVGREATKEQVKTAYINLAKTFHPDRLAQFKLQALRPEVERIFARVSEAQATLIDERRRKEYLRTLDGAAKGDAEKARKILDAEVAFQEGEMALRHKQFAEAEEFFRKSIELNGEEGEHHAMLGWAMYQNPANVRGAILEVVKQHLFRAVKLSRTNPRPYYLLGEIYLQENDLDKAIAQFRKALDLRESHVDAERGLRLAIMRKEKGGGKGIFDRFKKR